MIGFAKNLVPLVKSGEKTLTYRLGIKYADLQVGDKIKAKDSSTGKPFAEIEIIDKQLTTFSELPINKPGHEQYQSREEMRKTFQKYYEQEVADDKPIVIIEFKLAEQAARVLQAVIFDLDGVLIDSPKYIWQSFNKLLEGKVSFTDDDIRMYLASSLRENAKSWRKRFGVEINDLEAFSREAGKIQFELMKEVKPSMSLVQLLKALQKNDIKIGVGTSSMKWRAENILNLLSILPYFETLVTSDDVEHHKPHPEVFTTVAEKLVVDPRQCIVIEDAVNGIEAAHNGGMKAVGLVTEYHPAQELKDADMVINDFSELTIERLQDLMRTN